MRLLNTLSVLAMSVLIAGGIAGCKKDDDNNTFTTPGTDTTRTRPGWGPSMSDSMLVVIEKLQSFSAPPIESLTP